MAAPLFHQTDLFRPHNDPDDHFDLAVIYALALQGKIDLRGIVPGPQPEFGDGRLRERLEKMERRIQELQERLFGQEKRAGEKPIEESTK